MSAWVWLREPRWRAALFLAFAAALNYGDRAAISSVLPALRSEFSLTDTQLGLVGSMFLWSYAIASPFAGILADRWSRRSQVVWSLVLWSLATAFLGAANGLLTLLVLRAALGLAESLYLPAATALLADHHGPETRARAMSIHGIGLNFGVVIGGTFAGYLAEHFGWRSGFWVLGLGGVVMALSSGPLLRDAPRSKPEIQRSPERPSATTRPGRSIPEALAYLIRVPSFHVLLAKALLTGVGTWIFLSWLPLYLREAFDMTLGSAGFAGTFMLQISVVLGLALGGWISDRAAATDGRRRLLLQGICYLIAAPFLLLFLAKPGFALVAVAVSMFSLFRGLGHANENPTLCEVIPVQYRSTAIGIFNTCGTAAGGVGVLLAGMLKGSHGLNAVFAGISLLFVISGLSLLAAYRFWADRDLQRARDSAL